MLKQEERARLVAADAPPGKEWWRITIEVANRLNISYWVIRLCGFLAAVLPMWVSYAIGQGLGLLVYFAWGALRNRTIANMRRVLGEGTEEEPLRRTARAAVLNYFKYLVEFLRFPSLAGEDIERLIDSSGWENVDRALQGGKGAIFISVHLGNWDIAGAMIAQQGYPTNIVVESFKPERLNRLIQHHRLEKGIKIIPLEGGARQMLRALRQNEVLCLLIDRPVGSAGVVVEFCGGFIRIPAGAATLALKTGAKLLPGYLVRRPDNTFVGTIAPPIEPVSTGDGVRDVQVITQKMMKALETWVKQYPEQWHMFRPMWVEATEADGGC